MGQDGRTQWTVVSWHFTLWASTLIRLLADTADIIVIIIVLVRLAVSMYLVRLGRGAPFPSCDGVVADYGHFHRVASTRDIELGERQRVAGELSVTIRSGFELEITANDGVQDSVQALSRGLVNECGGSQV